MGTAVQINGGTGFDSWGMIGHGGDISECFIEFDERFVGRS